LIGRHAAFSFVSSASRTVVTQPWPALSKTSRALAWLRKWQPIRRACRDFTKRGGLKFDGKYLQLYARDLYQFNLQELGK